MSLESIENSVQFQINMKNIFCDKNKNNFKDLNICNTYTISLDKLLFQNTYWKALYPLPCNDLRIFKFKSIGK